MRPKKHEEYFCIEPYIQLKRLSVRGVAYKMGMTERTFRDKIKGYSDFTAEQGRVLSDIVGIEQSLLFET